MKELLDEHISIQHDEIYDECRICGYKVPQWDMIPGNEDSLDLHMSKNHGLILRLLTHDSSDDYMPTKWIWYQKMRVLR